MDLEQRVEALENVIKVLVKAHRETIDTLSNIGRGGAYIETEKNEYETCYLFYDACTDEGIDCLEKLIKPLEEPKKGNDDNGDDYLEDGENEH